MKKIVTKIAMISVFMAGASFAQAQSSGTNSEAEVVATGTSVSLPSTQALLDHQFTIDITASTGSVGNAGVVHLGTSFWVAKWNSDTESRSLFVREFSWVFTRFLPGWQWNHGNR